MALSALALFLVAAWEIRSIYPVTGDGPHYVIVARSIAQDRTIDPTDAYERDFAVSGRAPAGSPLTPENSHTYPGPHGRHSVHSPGLPLLLSIPVAIGGTAGAELAMIVLAAPLAIAAWYATGAFIRRRRVRLLATLAVVATMPFVAASGQVYPDLIAGIIGLSGLMWFHRLRNDTPLVTDLALATLLAYLPWLQIKSTVPMLVIVVAIAVRLIRRRLPARAALVVAITVASAIALGAYNYWAFRNVSGPYESDALVLGQKPAMVLLALLLDQKQGILFQGPVFWVGLVYLPRFIRRSTSLALLTLATAATFLIPNAMHTNWFGGWSLVGRFEWSAAATLIIPTVYGLGELHRSHRRLFAAVVTCLGLVQLVMLTRLAFAGQGTEMMNTAPADPASYPFLYGRFGRWLPVLYDVPIAKHSWPNLVWIVIVAAVVAVGVLLAMREPRIRLPEPPLDYSETTASSTTDVASAILSHR